MANVVTAVRTVDADGNVVETVVIDALGHGYQWQNTKNATCTEEGYEGYYTCSACTKLFNAEYVEIAAPVVIGKANHTMTHYDAEAPTCTETGAVEFYQCGTCNKFYADEQGTTEITDLEVPMVAHTYGEWIAQVDATTEAEGTLGHYHCDVCGKDFDAEYEELDSLVIPKVEKPEEPKTDDVSSLFGGCKASLSLGSIGIVALLSMAGVAMVAKRKED
jgi:DNA-directed RNA polymerase subunit RPC12/RpoP